MVHRPHLLTRHPISWSPWAATLCVSAALYALVLFQVLSALHPLRLPDRDASFAVTVVADDDTPLRSFPDDKGVWRYPVTPAEVSPLYIDALVNYEDRYFRRHPGINPLALVRAFGQMIRAGHLVSGGSTLTMQVARILHPHPRTLVGKLTQMFRAVQLEAAFSKDRILTYYLNYAPFGGPIEGVQAASFAYLGKSAKTLTHAEAALLAVLPQSPTRLRPDRHPDRAAKARNKVLDRMAKFGVWRSDTVQSAKIEPVVARFDPHPMKAPLLARRLKDAATPMAPVRTFIDPFLQQTVADLVANYIVDTPDHTSAAVLVVENDTLVVRAYVGSADFLDDARFGHVDMIQAIRSPGSTLKPFLYGFALEEGLIHSASLMADAPFSFSGYRPDNFTRYFTGPVSAEEALQRSLNLPAVDLLDRLGPGFFDARLRQGGLHLLFPPHVSPNLTMILGGVGASLEALTGAYASLSRAGLSGDVRLTRDQPLKERRMLTPGAAYIIRQILQETRRPDLPGGRLSMERARQVAWKTGTSYGFRDAWTVGVTDRHTLGVWVGRPDGTPSPGQYGRITAAPLLFRIVDALPRRHGPIPPVPDSVARQEICWPLGTPPRSADDPLCHVRKTAWVLGDVIPPTLPDRSDRFWQPNPLTVWINPETGLRTDAACGVADPERRVVARWPKALTPWLTPRIRRASRIPPLDPRCVQSTAAASESVRIMGIQPDTVLRPPGAYTELPTIALQALGGEDQLYWLLNDELIARCGPGEIRYHQFAAPGRYQLTVMDVSGNFDTVSFMVMGGHAVSASRVDARTVGYGD